jgi:hypothetical protein
LKWNDNTHTLYIFGYKNSLFQEGSTSPFSRHIFCALLSRKRAFPIIFAHSISRPKSPAIPLNIGLSASSPLVSAMPVMIDPPHLSKATIMRGVQARLPGKQTSGQRPAGFEAFT